MQRYSCHTGAVLTVAHFNAQPNSNDPHAHLWTYALEEPLEELREPTGYAGRADLLLSVRHYGAWPAC